MQLSGPSLLDYGLSNGVARKLKSYAHQRETTGSSNDSFQLHSFSIWELLLRAVPYGTENHFYYIRRPPLNVTIFFTHVLNLHKGRYANG